MLDVRFIRENPDLVAEGARKKGVPLDMAALLALDAEVPALRPGVRTLRERRNALSRGFAAARGDADRQAVLSGESRALGEELAAAETRLREREDALHELLLRVPNPPDPSVPEGTSDAENVPIAFWG